MNRTIIMELIAGVGHASLLIANLQPSSLTGYWLGDTLLGMLSTGMLIILIIRYTLPKSSHHE